MAVCVLYIFSRCVEWSVAVAFPGDNLLFFYVTNLVFRLRGNRETCLHYQGAFRIELKFLL